MAERTYITTANEEAALADTVARQNQNPIDNRITIEEYFNQRTSQWIGFLVRERAERIRIEDAEAAAIALDTERTITTLGNDGDRLRLEELQERARQLKSGERTR